MNVIFQLLDLGYGRRSEPMGGDLEDIKAKLSAVIQDEPEVLEQIVIVLADDVSGEMAPSRAPLMKVSTFIGVSHAQRDDVSTTVGDGQSGTL